MTRPTPLPQVDPDIRKTDVAEIAAITGWTQPTVTRAIRAGKLPGCRHLPPEGDARQGQYVCAFKPFTMWWFHGIEVAPVPRDETNAFIRRIRTLDSVDRLLERELTEAI